MLAFCPRGLSLVYFYSAIICSERRFHFGNEFFNLLAEYFQPTVSLISIPAGPSSAYFCRSYFRRQSVNNELSPFRRRIPTFNNNIAIDSTVNKW